MRGIQRWLALVARRCPSGCVERMGEALRHSCERGLKRPSGTGGDQVAQLLRRDARFHSQVIGDVLQPLEHSRHLSLREQVDLQVEVAAFVGLSGADEPASWVVTRGSQRAEPESGARFSCGILSSTAAVR